MIVLKGFDPVALRLGPISVRWYGLAYVAGFLTGWGLGRWRASRPGSGWTPNEFDDLLSWLMVGVVLGGRLGYALFYAPAQYLADPLSIFEIWHGGMSFHGGMLGVLAALWWHGRRSGRGFLSTGDFVAPLVPPGLFFGRLANFVNGELWGRATDVPWAMVFPDPSSGGLPRHPSQLYEAGLEGLVLFTALWVFSSRPRRAGQVGGLFLTLYGLFRFSLEFVREPDIQLGLVGFGWLSMGQLLSLPMVALGLWLLLRRR